MPTTKNRLAEIRGEAGLSRAALARELEVDQATVWRWENGERNLSDETKLRLAARFDVSVPYLMGWPEPKAAA